MLQILIKKMNKSYYLLISIISLEKKLIINHKISYTLIYRKMFFILLTSTATFEPIVRTPNKITFVMCIWFNEKYLELKKKLLVLLDSLGLWNVNLLSSLKWIAWF